MLPRQQDVKTDSESHGFHFQQQLISVVKNFEFGHILQFSNPTPSVQNNMPVAKLCKLASLEALSKAFLVDVRTAH